MNELSTIIMILNIIIITNNHKITYFKNFIFFYIYYLKNLTKITEISNTPRVNLLKYLNQRQIIIIIKMFFYIKLQHDIITQR